MDTIESMRTFAAVAAEQSFTGGGKRLDISTKLASKYVQQLETRLGVQLFNRTTRSVRLTDIGLAYLERCQPLLDQFEELEGLVQTRHSELAGRIRISAPSAFGSSELVAALAPFQMTHPKVSIDLHLSDKRVALIEDGHDLAVRFGKLEDSSLIARRLLDMRMVTVVSSQYLELHGEPEKPEALASHDCLIQQSSTTPEHWKFMGAGGTRTVRVNGSFRANSPRAIAHMAAQGLGIGRCPKYVADPFLKSGELQLLFEEMETSEFALYAVYPPNRYLTVRIRALIDHLVSFYADPSAMIVVSTHA
ncbi:LysR family transcriptional regulator [Granulosicoccus antarcticus]|uniref:HTH-type transcriptional regulator PgrR n=1 Tax=Granulosicoccus antarcticus IMCC3135 TaxID=1192854 RepID=A0A2Z2NVQ0_9GAMM|nr:LysR family transcriptional regulator [Granulosicoccus antarcticus]ASJ74111.1 HTH-type transcriptional regulator PgrR [Granulosicoccus antarcticus IMCC3135]